jgi:hypothetical protein
LGSLRLALPVFTAAGRVYVRGLLLIVPVAVAVFGVTDVGLHAVDDWLSHPVDVADTGSIALGIALLVVVLTSSMFAEILFAGLLDRVVEADIVQRPSPSVGEVVAGLPVGRLILADGLVVILGVAGLVLFVLPGLAAFMLLALAGPLVIIEGLGPWAAARRSFQLLRKRLGAAIVLVLIPGLVVTWVDQWLATMLGHWSVVAEVVAEVAVDATLAAYAGLLLAVLARRLVSAPAAPVVRSSMA